jgi:hypothetical protein
MADVGQAVIAGPARDWLAAQRKELNSRFRLAQRRFPSLDADAVLALCRELLPPLAGPDAATATELLSAVYDLILLHAGRGLLAPGAQSGVALLVRETFPALRPLLAARPRHLPGALSNAVENVGPRGVAFARGLAILAPHVGRPEDLLDAGAVLAWRLGDARLRNAALGIAERLTAPAMLAALGLPDWPAQAAPLVVVGLRASGWCRPEELLSQQTLAKLAGAPPDRLDKLRQNLATLADAAAEWRLAGRLGNFGGFDGHFDQPPVLLDAPAETGGHRFQVRCGPSAFRIDADAFGWVCQPAAAVDAPVGKAKSPPRVKLPERTTSTVLRPGAIAYTTADSFRVRVLTPARKPP